MALETTHNVQDKRYKCYNSDGGLTSVRRRGHIMASKTLSSLPVAKLVSTVSLTMLTKL
jgi:hypothetical protein